MRLEIYDIVTRKPRTIYYVGGHLAARIARIEQQHMEHIAAICRKWRNEKFSDRQLEIFEQL